MYGRVLSGITLRPDELRKGVGGSGAGGNKLLFNQLTFKDEENEGKLKDKENEGKLKDKENEGKLFEPTLARIYAMSFEGTFYNLPKPTIFLVHGGGTDVPSKGFAAGKQNQPDMDASGMAARDFEWESDVKYWEYDKDDVSLRLDVVTGTLDEILVDATLSATSRYALTSRADLTARADLAARADVASRADLTSRADLAARHRLRE
jgi:hypothetical protein